MVISVVHEILGMKATRKKKKKKRKPPTDFNPTFTLAQEVIMAWLRESQGQLDAARAHRQRALQLGQLLLADKEAQRDAPTEALLKLAYALAWDTQQTGLEKRRPAGKSRDQPRRPPMKAIMSAMLTWMMLCLPLSQASHAKTTLPPIKRAELPNGLKVLMLPNRANPFVELQFVAKVGSALDPAGKEGLANFTATMLTNGTPSRSEEIIAETIEAIGARLSAGASYDNFELGGSVVTLDKAHLDTFLDVFADVLRNASFPDSSLEKNPCLAGGSPKTSGRPPFRPGGPSISDVPVPRRSPRQSHHPYVAEQPHGRRSRGLSRSRLDPATCRIGHRGGFR